MHFHKRYLDKSPVENVKYKKLNTTAWNSILEVSYYAGVQIKRLPEDLRAVSHSKARVNRVTQWRY